MMKPPMNSAAANCQPSNTTRTTPSSITRLVEANMKAIAVVKSAPLRMRDRDIAAAAYEQLDDAMPKNDARASDGAR